MSACIQVKREKLTENLLDAGFSAPSIETAYTKIFYCKDTERKSGRKSMTPRLINEAANEVTIYTYILKEALEDMLNEWGTEKLGKVAEKNLEVYKEVCTSYYDKVKMLLKKEH